MTDPSLTIMVCTKANAAAQACAEHLLSLNLPDSVLGRMGRLAGYLETSKAAANRTPFDIQSQNRNNVLRTRNLLMGCGGGFKQEAR